MTTFADKLVMDETGLDDYFKIVLNFSPESPDQNMSSEALLPKALQEQLGLKLVSPKGQSGS